MIFGSNYLHIYKARKLSTPKTVIKYSTPLFIIYRIARYKPPLKHYTHGRYTPIHPEHPQTQRFSPRQDKDQIKKENAKNPSVSF